MGDLSLVEVCTRLGLAVLLGGLVGFERERSAKPAGLRTHMLVALGAACFTMIALEITEDIEDSSPGRIVQDPGRIVQGIVEGIGFLGAGAILRQGANVKGLTTAGSIWLVGALGLAAGGGAWRIAVATVVFAIFVLQVVGYLEWRWMGKDGQRPGPGTGPGTGSGPAR